jgi:hypothetical protein
MADSNIAGVPFERIAGGIPFNDSKPGFTSEDAGGNRYARMRSPS